MHVSANKYGRFGQKKLASIIIVHFIETRSQEQSIVTSVYNK